MSFSGKEWIWPDHNHDQVMEFARNLQVPPALARLLIKRGIIDQTEARAFLSPAPEQLHSPWLMLGMEQSVARICEAIEKNQQIMIHGDYDADGISATVILVEAIRALGGQVDYFLPNRFEEGYGLHIEPLVQFKAAGVSLVVTVDCGINAVKEVAYASKIGLDLIVTDHHQPRDPLQEAVAVINPLQEKCPYPFKDLSGAGIAFKLAVALMEKNRAPFPFALLDMAALGTTADVVPLLGENRAIVSEGLDVLRGLGRVGFKALVEAVGLEKNRISSTSLAYILAPSVNAAGRMGAALPAAQLMLEKDELVAAELAGNLHRSNLQRRSTEKNILAAAETAAEAQLAAGDGRIITLAGDGWHHGVIGIVASRLVERFNRPVALIALDGDDGRGSARSIPGFDITAALADSAQLLSRFGGHEQAAGFAIPAEKVAELRDNLNRYALQQLGDHLLKGRLYIDAELEEEEIELKLVSNLDSLQPYGTANSMPLFGSRAWQIQSWRLVGADQSHLKLKVAKKGRILEPIVFSGARYQHQLEKGRLVNLAFRLKSGSFRDKTTLDLEVKDISYSDTLTCDSLELVDRRGCKNRKACLKELLTRKTGHAVIFVSTAERAKAIRSVCPPDIRCSFITSGAMRSGLELSESADLLIIYDLPLNSGLLAPVFNIKQPETVLPVYLFYNEEDYRHNIHLLALALPLAEELTAIFTAQAAAAEDKEEKKLAFPDATVLKNLNWHKGPTFWERVEKIFAETGLLREGCLDKDPDQPEKDLSVLLQSAPTYRSVRETWEDCEKFQQNLINGSLEEIASHLN
jgi:single-stranded-DNA-specific exonuclease